MRSISEKSDATNIAYLIYPISRPLMRYEMHLSDENVHGRMLLRPAYDNVSRVPNMVTNKKKHKSNKGTMACNGTVSIVICDKDEYS